MVLWELSSEEEKGHRPIGKDYVVITVGIKDGDRNHLTVSGCMVHGNESKDARMETENMALVKGRRVRRERCQLGQRVRAEHSE